MFRGWYGEPCIVAGQVEQVGMVACKQVRAHVGIESACPVMRAFGVLPVHLAQVVHDIAAAKDQHPGFTQWTQVFRQFVVLLRREVDVQAKLQYRDISGGKQMCQDRPGAMVDAPVVVKPCWPGGEQAGDFGGQSWIARGRIEECVERIGKAGKIVNGLGLLHRGDCAAACQPVR
jgi:hypothetical protein